LSLEIPSIAIQHERLIEVDERQPDLIPFSREQLARVRKEIERAPRIALMSGGDGQVGDRFRRFIDQPQFLEAGERARRQCVCLVAEVQFQVDLRPIQIAERAVIRVASLLGLLLCGLIQLQRTRVLAAHVVEVRDVVIGLGDQKRHVVRLAISLRFAIGLERVVELIQADRAHRQVDQRRAHVLRPADLHQLLVRARVERARFLEAILAEKNVADVAVEARETKRVAAPFENLARLLCQCERLVVPPEREDALKQATVQRPADVELIPQRAKQLERLLIVL